MPNNKEVLVTFFGIIIIVSLSFTIIRIYVDSEYDSYDPIISQNPNFQRGITYVPFATDLLLNENEYDNINRMLATNSEWVALIPIWYQENGTSTIITPHAEESPSDASIRYAIQYLHSKNKNVMLKPYVDARDETWRAEFQPLNWSAWFSSYQKFIWHYAEIAEDEDIELFCVGCEYKSSDTMRYDDWLTTITGIWNRYSGNLTYAADWSNYDSVCFWDLLDYIGIDAYFPLYEGNNPNLSDLINGWNLALNNIEEWHIQSNFSDIQIIFTEVGYESQPICWENPAETGKNAVDLNAQDLCYKALFSTVPSRQWLEGMFIWWWDNPTTHDTGGGLNNNGWTPKGKPSEITISNYYGFY